MQIKHYIELRKKVEIVLVNKRNDSIQKDESFLLLLVRINLIFINWNYLPFTKIIL